MFKFLPPVERFRNGCLLVADFKIVLFFGGNHDTRQYYQKPGDGLDHSVRKIFELGEEKQNLSKNPV